MRTAIDSDGRTPLHHACHEGQKEMVKLMVEVEENNLKSEMENKEWNPEVVPAFKVKDNYGRSPVFLTTSLDIIELLVGIDDIDILDSDDNLTLDKIMEGLGMAIENGDERFEAHKYPVVCYNIVGTATLIV